MKTILISFMEFDDDRRFNINKFTVLPKQNHYPPTKQTEKIYVSVEWLLWTVVKSFSDKRRNPLVHFTGQSVIFCYYASELDLPLNR